MPAKKVVARPALPKLAHGEPLSRGIVLASCPGWERGFNQDNLLTCFEDHWGGRANSNGVALSVNQYEHVETYGAPSLEDGSPAPAFSQFPNATAGSRNRFQVSGGLSVFALVRPESNGNDNAPFFKCRATPLGVANNGWDLTLTTANHWRARLSNGAAESVLTGTSTPSIVTSARESHVVGFTYNELTSLWQLFVDGTLEASSGVAVSLAAVNNSQTPKLFGSGVLSTDFSDTSVGMIGVWSRELSRGEVSRLYADPFEMWRTPEDDMAGIDFQTYFTLF